MNRPTNRFTCEAVPDPDRRAFFTHTAMAAAAGVAAAAGLHAVPAKGATATTRPTADQRKYTEEGRTSPSHGASVISRLRKTSSAA